MRVKRLFNHPELDAAYPHGFTKTNEHAGIMGMPVQLIEGGNASGMFVGPLPYGIVGLHETLPPGTAKSAMAHELQHAVQEREGFARGQSMDAPHWETGPDGKPKWIDPKEAYARNAGEVEARNAQARLHMNAEDRRATPPWETQDVSDAQQILRQYGGSPQMSTKDILKLYRGESSHNKKDGPYYSPDREWARQFTQSGRDHEIRAASVKSADVYDPPNPVYAGDPDAIAAVVAEARKKGFKAVRLDEGKDQPQSVYVFNKTGLQR